MSVLVDTSVWIDHLRAGEAHLVDLLHESQVLVHDAVIGELALGSLRDRSSVLSSLERLPRAPIASTIEARTLVERHSLHGSGIGWVDVHLLAATLLAPGTSLWTRDKRLSRSAGALGVEHLVSPA